MSALRAPAWGLIVLVVVLFFLLRAYKAPTATGAVPATSTTTAAQFYSLPTT